MKVSVSHRNQDHSVSCGVASCSATKASNAGNLDSFSARSMANRIQKAFVPERELVCAEYWPRRKLLWALSLVNVFKTTLTIQALYVAIGVGNVKSSPMSFIILQEISNAMSRVVGLGLSTVLPSAPFAAHAKFFCVVISALQPFLIEAFEMILFSFPDYLASITMTRSILQACMRVASRPADAAICNHVKATRDSAKRANLDQMNVNQECVLNYVQMVGRWLLIMALAEEVKPTTTELWTAFLVLSCAQMVLKVLLVQIAAMPSFNAARLRIVCDSLSSGTAPTPMDVANVERWLPRRPGGDFVAIDVGVSAEGLLEILSEGALTEDVVTHLFEAQLTGQHVLAGSARTRRLSVMLRDSAGAGDAIRAWWHAYRAGAILSKLGEGVCPEDVTTAVIASHPTDTEWEKLQEQLQAQGWWLDQALLPAVSEWRWHSPAGPAGLWLDGCLLLKQVRRTSAGALLGQAVRLHATGAVTASQMDGARDASAPSATEVLYSMLVPKGFPATVAPEYMTYQLWDTLQVMTEDLRGIIIKQAGLIAIGVGIKGATPLGSVKVDLYLEALVTTVGLAVGLVCDSGASVATMKSWRVYNTILSYFSAAMGLLGGIFPHHRLPIASISNTVTGIIGPFGRGASQAVVMHLSNDSMDAAFRADVAAKETNQDSLLGLCLLPVRYCLLLFVGLNFSRAWGVAAVLSVGHVLMNAMAVRVLRLRSLNGERLMHLAEAWRDGKQEHMSPAAISKQERLLPWLSSQKWPVALGVSMEMPCNLDKLLELHSADGYVLGGSCEKSKLIALLKQESNAEDQLRAWFQAFCVRTRLTSAGIRPSSAQLLEHILESHTETVEQFPKFLVQLEANGWAVDRARMTTGTSVLLNAGRWRYQSKTD